jgi:hypothetical protein
MTALQLMCFSLRELAIRISKLLQKQKLYIHKEMQDLDKPGVAVSPPKAKRKSVPGAAQQSNRSSKRQKSGDGGHGQFNGGMKQESLQKSTQLNPAAQSGDQAPMIQFWLSAQEEMDSDSSSDDEVYSHQVSSSAI